MPAAIMSPWPSKTPVTHWTAKLNDKQAAAHAGLP
jgi:hypothetical protein